MHLHRGRLSRPTTRSHDRRSPEPGSIDPGSFVSGAVASGQPTRQEPVSTRCTRSAAGEDAVELGPGERVGDAAGPGSIANATPDDPARRRRRAAPPESPGAGRRRARAPPRRSSPSGRCRCRWRSTSRRPAPARRAAGPPPGGRRPRRSSPTSASPSGRRGHVEPVDAQHREVAVGVERDDAASSRRPSAGSTSVSRSPATTCALVTTRSGADGEAGPVDWIWSHAWPSHPHRRARRRARPRRGRARGRGGPTSAGLVEGANTSGNGPSATSRPSFTACGGGSGAYSSIACTISEPRAPRAPASPASSRARG